MHSITSWTQLVICNGYVMLVMRFMSYSNQVTVRQLTVITVTGHCTLKLPRRNKSWYLLFIIHLHFGTHSLVLFIIHSVLHCMQFYNVMLHECAKFKIN